MTLLKNHPTDITKFWEEENSFKGLSTTCKKGRMQIFTSTLQTNLNNLQQKNPLKPQLTPLTKLKTHFQLSHKNPSKNSNWIREQPLTIRKKHLNRN